VRLYLASVGLSNRSLIRRPVRVDASFCRFQQRAEIVNRRTRVFCGRLRLRGFLEE
jgi:hypothetical protein